MRTNTVIGIEQQMFIQGKQSKEPTTVLLPGTKPSIELPPVTLIINGRLIPADLADIANQNALNRTRGAIADTIKSSK